MNDRHTWIATLATIALLVGYEALLALLHPEETQCVPWYTYVDVRLNRYRHRRLWLGNRNPIQRLKSFVAKKRLEKQRPSRRSKD